MAHLFINTGHEVLDILDIGSKDEGDIVDYPDEKVYYIRDESLAFNMNSKIRLGILSRISK